MNPEGDVPVSRLRAAVVTGAASGMGNSTARQLLKLGWHVIGMDRDALSLQASLADSNHHFHPCVADVTDRTAVEKALVDAMPDGIPLEAVVNAAGIYPPSTISSFTEEQYRRIFDTNVLGVLNVTAAVLPMMRAHSGGGAIVNFASVDALAVSLGQLLYSASKAAVLSITRYLAVELAADRIVVNGVARGWVDTPGNRATGRMETALQQVPLRRAARPEEIADWVCRLCNRDSYMTGETLVIAGGLVLR
jgi:3-oxoacyl-[acyl-carrier protein] reductase